MRDSSQRLLLEFQLIRGFFHFTVDCNCRYGSFIFVFEPFGRSNQLLVGFLKFRFSRRKFFVDDCAGFWPLSEKNHLESDRPNSFSSAMYRLYEEIDESETVNESTVPNLLFCWFFFPVMAVIVNSLSLGSFCTTLKILRENHLHPLFRDNGKMVNCPSRKLSITLTSTCRLQHIKQKPWPT